MNLNRASVEWLLHRVDCSSDCLTFSEIVNGGKAGLIDEIGGSRYIPCAARNSKTFGF